MGSHTHTHNTQRIPHSTPHHTTPHHTTQHSTARLSSATTRSTHPRPLDLSVRLSLHSGAYWLWKGVSSTEHTAQQQTQRLSVTDCSLSGCCCCCVVCRFTSARQSARALERCCSATGSGPPYSAATSASSDSRSSSSANTTLEVRDTSDTQPRQVPSLMKQWPRSLAPLITALLSACVVHCS